MKIGIDFDNTIVSYDKVFYEVALEKSLIPPHVRKSKIAVRDYLRNKQQNDIWTELQGYVYGKRMIQAEIFKGFIDFLDFSKKNNLEIVIISHKTKYPYEGKKYDLHESAKSWIARYLQANDKNLVDSKNIFFLPTKEKKVDKITAESCDYFIDDLPEIFSLKNFPPKTCKILFDPEKNHVDLLRILKFMDWDQITEFFKENARKLI